MARSIETSRVNVAVDDSDLSRGGIIEISIWLPDETNFSQVLIHRSGRMEFKSKEELEGGMREQVRAH